MPADVTRHTFTHHIVYIRDASSREDDDRLERRVVAQTPRDGHDIRLDEHLIVLHFVSISQINYSLTKHTIGNLTHKGLFLLLWVKKTYKLKSDPTATASQYSAIIFRQSGITSSVLRDPFQRVPSESLVHGKMARVRKSGGGMRLVL